MFVEVNNARFWVEDEGSGPAILFFHGGLGDSRLFEPQARALADAFRCVRFDIRLWGRTEAPGEPFSWVDDAVGVLDALGIDRAALVGLSFGGGMAVDVALAHPDRVTALVHVAAGMSGMPVNPYSEEQQASDDEMAADFEVWAPLGADDRLRELWQSTPEAKGVPDGAEPAASEPARPEELRCPVLVITAEHDPPAQVAVGRALAERAPDARLVAVDSDHYLTLREPELVTRLIRDFLA